jgi:biotin carboxyl carrier protein
MSDKNFTLPDGKSFQVIKKGANTFSLKSDSKSLQDLTICSSAETIDSQTQRIQFSSSDGRTQLFWIYAKGNKRILSWPGGSIEIESSDLSEGLGAAGGSVKPLKLTMPGKVLSIKVREGDLVESGQDLIIVEAMKMENLLLAPTKAKVEKILVKEGDRLESGTVLITFSEA